ncbi:hypothetical protein [Streptomyces sp. AC602_WCS936]|uniref:hypothetical protein n=1 Tax=Streptomyces sp. AC602_WCS936 TaxID=2823685 RepID=UPI001C25E259|nr:hypothetical protein [Streptomyces sp. AC602_WCS936]
MAYSARNWWTEVTVFFVTTVVCSAVLILLWVAAFSGTGASAGVWGFVLPGGLVGLWAARRYRRRHDTD